MSVYPLLLLVVGGACAGAIIAELDLEQILIPFFMGIIVLLCVLERVMPYRAHWQPTGREVGRDAIYFFLGMFFGGLAQVLTGAAAIALATEDNRLPLWVAAPLAILIMDLCTYGFHRWAHVNGWMWREHGIHHLPGKVNTLNFATAHFLDILFNNIAAYLPLLLMGFSVEAVFIASIARSVQTLGIHANIDVHVGWLGHFIMAPEHHRLHHSADPEEAGNYGTVFTLWDRVFGTYRRQPAPVAKVGVMNERAFPAPERILACLRHPFAPRHPVADPTP